MPADSVEIDDLIETDILAYLEQHERKEILRFLTCGSVDDGKSTLIGRLLHDSKMIYEDQLDSIRNDSKRVGTQGDQMDLALLVDGLQAEREQGITIDVAYRYFSTTKRKFIIADCPGHEQYTRNMATGASTCDVAVILIDAANGVLPQTKRHTYITTLLGIKHLIVAVNKMDLVGFAESRFEAIRDSYQAFASQLSVEDLQFIPISALAGDNVVEQSTNMPWYQGATLMHLLETVHIAGDIDLSHFRMPVQRVNRPDSSFRGYSGSIAAGIVHPGDPVRVLPSGLESKVSRIVTMDGDLDAAFPPMAVTLTLDDEIDISRGDILAAPTEIPHVSDRFHSTVVWMSSDPLEIGKQYVIKHTSKKVIGRVESIAFKTDINTLEQDPGTSLALNEIGRVEMSVAEPIVFDGYGDNRTLGSFVVIDRLSNVTVGAGMIIDPGGAVTDAAWDEVPHGELFESPGTVSSAEKAERLGQKPVAILMTGLSRSGKTAVAQAVERKLFDRGRLGTVIDGQQFRLGMSRDLGFSEAERSENVRRATESAKLMVDVGLICLMTFIVPREHIRARVRQAMGDDRFLEVFLTAPIEVLKSRDTAGFYAAAERGEIPSFPGVSSPFEAPSHPHLVLDTSELDVGRCADEIIALLVDQGFIR